jgi:flavorubredoxin
MGAEELEESIFEPFIKSIEGKIAGKTIALFGSYGWGDGEWMRNWDARMEMAGAHFATESLIVNETPSGAEAERCKEFGALVAG